MNKEKDIKIFGLMLRMYCKNKHKHKEGLCDECCETMKYMIQRRTHCPYGDDKPFCSNCSIHCYNPIMREKVKKIMKFAGPRILLYHPFVVISHTCESKRNKK